MLGQSVGDMGARALRQFRSRVGVVWQKHNLVPRLSALSNVLHGVQARMSGPRSWWQWAAPAEVRAEAMACLARVGLADKALQRVDSLSGGQQQRVAIARMLMQRHELVLADEPDASLDPQSGEDVMRLLSDLARQDGLTLIIISHRLEHTLAFSDRIIGLSGGVITLDVATSQADPAMLRRFFDKPTE
jgi:phosphonate transport system ATP-binding protein